ncbi:hypothetical protein GCM10023223_29490 [Stackebrandtia albiflava]
MEVPKVNLRHLGRRRSTVLAVATATATVAALATTGNLVWAEDADLGVDEFTAGKYIVQVAGEPVASYDGGVSGFDATASPEGERLDADSADAERYRDYLAELRADVLDQVPGADTLFEYDTVLNGFAVELTAAEAKQMSTADGVLRMWHNETLRLDTSNTPDFLGLTGEGGVWQNQFGGSETAGEGVIVGVIDTGFWPENPSFAPLPEPRPDQEIIDVKWNGVCDEGNAGPDGNITCNNKVIGARYYNYGDAPTDEGEFNSPRDFGGHGSHTASTAAGNYGVDTGKYGEISGMAPAARLAIYKVCWETGGGCATASSVAAIEDAVNDGVDVLNFSISGSTTHIVDPVHLAFFNAAAAGVFVANSAGNSGPGASTVAHNTPWITTVAASTHDRDFTADLTLGDGSTFTGSGRSLEPLASTAAVLSDDVGAEGANPTAVSQCHIGSLDPALAEGKIVACARGSVALVDKSAAVAEAGGVGMILYNVAGGAETTLAIDHSVPTIHVGIEAGEAVTSYLSAGDGTASFAAAEQIVAKAPVMSDFSSTGPALAGGGDLLKPDITAPGVDVIAAVAPPGNGGQDFASYQGTSMSSPHIAGLGALLKATNPEWSPSAIRSAMMTTASQTDNEGDPITRHTGAEATPFSYGAGHVVPGDMFDPGLVYDSGPDEWLQYGCAIGQFQLIGYSDLCDAYPAIDPSDLNYPSVAIGDLAGTQKVTRTVTNVSDKTSTYFPIIEAPEGVKVTVNKKSLTLRPGKSATFTLTITRTDASFNEYVFGSLTWKDFYGHEVRSPIAVQPVALAVDSEVTGEGTDGDLSLDGVAGYTGNLNTSVAGLAAGEVDEFTLSNPTGESFDTENPAENDHVKAIEVTVPEDATLSRFSTFQSDYGANMDLDLFFYQKVGEDMYYLGSSAAGGSDESGTLPGGATYVVYVDYFGGGAQTEDIKFHHWIVGGDEGNLVTDPANQKVSTGKKFSAGVSWSGLTAGVRYLGVVLYIDDQGNVLNTTTVNVNA